MATAATLSRAELPWFSAQRLVFGGGGLKCVAILEALKELKKREGVDFGAGIPRRPTSIAACSAGCLLALCVAMGMSVEEIEASAPSMDLKNISDAKLVGLASSHYALDDGTCLRAVLSRVILNRLGVNNCTLREFTQRCGIETLVLSTFSLQHQCPRYLSNATDPDMSLLDAVAASMAIPLVFSHIVHADGDVLVDGGVYDNVPWAAFPPDGRTLVFQFQFVAGLVGGLKMGASAPPPDFSFGILKELAGRFGATTALGVDISSWLLMPHVQRDRTIVIDGGEVTALDLLKGLLSSSPSTGTKIVDENVLRAAGRAAMNAFIDAWRAGRPPPRLRLPSPLPRMWPATTYDRPELTPLSQSSTTLGE